MEHDPDSYYLSWGGFQRNLKSTFADLAAEKNFTDVTLACEGEKQIAAHKVVLSASSPFFKQILIKNPHQHPLIYLKGVELNDLSSMIEFIYFGEVKMRESDLQSFLKLSEELEVKGLSGLFIQPEVPKYANDKKDFQTNVDALERDIDYETDLDKAVFIDEKDYLSETEFRNDLNGIVESVKEPKQPKPSISSSVSSDNLLQESSTNYEDINTLDQIPAKSTKLKRRTISLSFFSRSRSKERRSKRQQSITKLNIKENIKSNDYNVDEKLEERDNNYECDECEKTFKFEVGLSEHKETIHESITFKCVNCDTKCRTKENLHRHMELKDHY